MGAMRRFTAKFTHNHYRLSEEKLKWIRSGTQDFHFYNNITSESAS
jgi:hypothetical protein